MSKTKSTYTICVNIPHTDFGWKAIVTGVSRRQAVSACRVWVYRAVSSRYSHSDTAASEPLPWWHPGYPETRPDPKNIWVWAALSPWRVVVVKSKLNGDGAGFVDPKRVVEDWLVGPAVTDADDITLFGWCGLKLRTDLRDWDTFSGMLIGWRKYALAYVNHESVRKRIPTVYYDQDIHDLAYGADHVRKGS